MSVPLLSVENGFLTLKNAPQIEAQTALAESSKVQAKAYDELGIAIVGYFFKWLFGVELTVQADDGKWYVVSQGGLENYLRKVDKVKDTYYINHGLPADVIKGWLQEVKRKTNNLLTRIQNKFTKTLEKSRKADEAAAKDAASEPIEKVFAKTPPLWGVHKIMFEYATVTQEAQSAVENALRAAQGDVTRPAVQEVLLAHGGGEAFESLNLHDIIYYWWIDRIPNLAQVFPNLKDLNFENTWFSGRDLLLVAKTFRHLEKLNISHNGVAFPPFDPNENLFPELKELIINSCGNIFGYDYVTRLPLLPKLEKLTIQNHPWMPSIDLNPMPFFAERIPNLTHLDLSHSQNLPFEYLLELEQFPLLEELDLRACPSITAEQVEALRANNPDIRILHP